MNSNTMQHSPRETAPTIDCNLQGLSVLVTRPVAQSDTLCELIEQAHGRPVRFPAMEISQAADAQTARTTLMRALQADLLIFISKNAVQYAFPLMPEALPANLAIAAIGQATADELTEYGLEPTLVPDNRFDSEGLLSLPELQDMQGKQVIIVRGNGGRSRLRSELEHRGAKVDYAEVYQRLLPTTSAANLLTGWHRLVDVVTATSNQLLDNLFTLLGEEGRSLLQSSPLIVISPRMAEHAEKLGCQQIYLADNASDGAILAELCLLLSEANDET